MFLDSIRERQLEEERKRKEEDGVELASFREYVRLNYTNSRRANLPPTHRAVAARTGPVPPPPIPDSDPNTPKPKEDPPKPKPPVTRKDTKRSLKGVVVKKKTKAREDVQKKSEGGSKPDAPAPTEDPPTKGDDEKRPAKKQKVR